MHTILIADDEYFIRERLKVLLDYAALGYELVAEAGNGRHALGCIRQLEPDIAILDIKMPLLSGIEVAKEVHALGLRTRCIILTSYDVFEYARESLRHGIVDYLLKPVEPADLLRALELAAEQLRRRAQTDENALLLSGKMREEAFLCCLADRVEPGAIPPAVAGLLGDHNEFLLLRQRLSDVSRTAAGGLLPTLRRAPLPGDAFVFSYSENTVGLLLHRNLEEEHREHLLEAVRAAGVVNAAAGPPFSSARQLSDSFMKALAALERTLLLGDNSFAAWGREEPVGLFPLSGIRDNLLPALRTGHTDAALELVRGQFSLLRERYPTPGNLRALLTELLLTGYVYLQESRAEEFNMAGLAAQELVESHTDLEGIRLQVEAYLQGIVRSPDDCGRAQLADLVSEIKGYIRQHFHQPELGLDGIAAAISYSPNYVSSTFKRVVGISVVQYITKCRMEAARKLMLENRSAKIAEISARVGYTDVFYFSKCFKRYWGISPSALGGG